MKQVNKKLSILFMVAVLVVSTIGSGVTKANAKTFTQSGVYSTSLCKKKDKGNEYSSYAKKLVLKSKKMTLYGSMHYTKPGDVYSSKIYKVAKRTYVISSSCKYYKQKYKNGKFVKSKISKKKLKKLALPLDSGRYSNRSLRWKIQGGKVVELIYEEY